MPKEYQNMYPDGFLKIFLIIFKPSNTMSQHNKMCCGTLCGSALVYDSIFNKFALSKAGCHGKEGEKTHLQYICSYAKSLQLITFVWVSCRSHVLLYNRQITKHNKTHNKLEKQKHKKTQYMHHVSSSCCCF